MKIFLFVIFIVVGVFAREVEFSKEEREWIKKHPVITYVGDPNWLPFESINKEGKYIGIVADLLHYIEDVTSLKFKIIKTKSWRESLDIIKSGNAMMISQSEDANKQTNLLFSQVYYKNPIVLITDKNRYISSLEDVKEKKIAIIKYEPFYKKIQKEYPDIDFIDVKSVSDGLYAINDTKADVFVNTLARTSYYMAKLQFGNLKISGRTKFDVNLGFGVLPQDRVLKDIIDKVLVNIPKNVGNKILSKWITQKYIEKPDYTALKIAIGIFAVIFMMWVYFYLRLKKESQERIKAQTKMLKQQSKMAAMGEMLDAVAHQWKQPLNAITMYLDLLKSDFDDGLVDKAYIDELEEGTHAQIEHMLSTLNEFRNFFRPNTKIEDFNLLKLVNSVLLLTKDEFIKNNIEIDVQISENISLKGNQNEFKHLIINIINNAKDAFNENGINNRKIVIEATSLEDGTVLQISDNAGGIPPKVIEHIFEANFTTKEGSKGTGIGLYMSRQIVEKMGATIKVTNKNGGASFMMVF